MINNTKNGAGSLCVTQRFNSWDEFLEFTESPGEVDPVGGSEQAVSHSFHGNGNTWEATRRFALAGWEQGREKIHRARELLALPERAEFAERVLPEYGVAGDEVDVGRFVSGEPECMVSFRPSLQRARGKCVRFFVNMSVSCGYTEDVITRRGTLVACFVDLLESAGYRVEIWMSFSASSTTVDRDKNVSVETLVKLKSFDQRLEIDRIAFALCHPCSLRRLGFRAWEKLPLKHFKERIGPHYGYPCDARPETAEDGGFSIENTLTFGHAHWDDFRSDQGAVEFMRKLIGQWVQTED